MVLGLGEGDLLRLQLSVGDFREARDFIDAARKHEVETLEFSALVMAAIMCYARPFTKNEMKDGDSGKERPEVASTLALDSPSRVLGDELPLHDHVRRIRNKAVAHSEWSHNKVHIVPTSTAGVAFAGHKWRVTEEGLDLDAFRRIAEAMRRYCVDRLVEYGLSEK